MAANCGGTYPPESSSSSSSSGVRPARAAVAGFVEAEATEGFGAALDTGDAAGAMAFHEDNGEGNTRIVNCKVTRKPGTDRLLSTNADGFWSGSMRKGPTVMNSLIHQ